MRNDSQNSFVARRFGNRWLGLFTLLFLASVAVVASSCADQIDDTVFVPDVPDPPVPTRCIDGSIPDYNAPSPCSGNGNGVVVTCPDGSLAPCPRPERGMEIFQGLTGITPCSSCHLTTDQTLVGPGLQNLYTRTAGEEYVITSIRMPADFIAEGFTNIMPVFDNSQLNDDDLRDLLAYLETL